MPTSAELVLVDTSVAVPLSVTTHTFHEAALSALAHRRRGLSGHAAFETYSVLTRLPPPRRRPPAAIVRLLAENFPETRMLGAEAARDLLGRLAEAGIAGGAIYDALVGAAAVEHGLTLVTRDRRALATYRALGAAVELL